MATHARRSLLVPSLFVLALLGCSSADSVVGGDAGPDLGPDLGVDAPALDLPSIDVVDVPRVEDAPDAPVDVAPDAPAGCTTAGDCATDPGRPACDVTTGRCVACTPTDDRCPSGQYCVASTNTCAAGCRSDAACGASDADGGASSRRCDTATRACVDCLRDEHCPAGTLCVGNTCVTGCSAARACPGTQTCCGGACVDPQSNTAHCGACDQRCSVPNAAAACMNGACAVMSCTAPFADCDLSAANGCETDTSRSADHCGACNAPCAARPNTVASCAAGACAYACAMGFADCDGDPSNGCEVDTRSSSAHCGGCGVVCNPPNATGACVAGACAVTACAAGYGDCDANATNGCEVDTRGSTSHCGMCGRACPAVANALPGCVGSTCVMACLAGFADCNTDASDGCEVDTRADVNHCGRCGDRCVRANATGTCRSGLCAVATCDANFGDCDGDPSNGCEVNTQTSPSHCGMCGSACPAPPNAVATCAGATCGFTCAAGFGDCDGDASNGCEVDLRVTPSHCGACGNACSSGVCAASACQAPRCDDGVRNGSESDTDCGGSCPRCDLCRGCGGGGDCTTGVCNSAGRCTFRTDVTVNWLTNCFGPGGGNTAVSVASMPAGTYTVTALDSAGTVWTPVNYPTTGWFWNIICDNLAAPALATPAGVYYPTPAAAFAALPTTTTTATFAGGTLSCRFNDSACSDNQGGVRFRVERACP